MKTMNNSTLRISAAINQQLTILINEVMNWNNINGNWEIIGRQWIKYDSPKEIEKGRQEMN